MSFTPGQTLLDSTGRRVLTSDGKKALDGCVSGVGGENCAGDMDDYGRLYVLNKSAIVNSIAVNSLNFTSVGGTSSYDFSVSSIAITHSSGYVLGDMNWLSSWTSIAIPASGGGTVTIYYQLSLTLNNFTSPSGEAYDSQDWDKANWSVSVAFSTTASFTGYIATYTASVDDTVTSVVDASATFDSKSGAVSAAFTRCWCTSERGSVNRWMMLPEPTPPASTPTYPGVAISSNKAYPIDATLTISVSSVIRNDDSHDDALEGSFETKRQFLIEETSEYADDDWLTDPSLGTANHEGGGGAAFINIDPDPEDASYYSGLTQAEYGWSPVTGLSITRYKDTVTEFIGHILAQAGIRDERNMWGYWNDEGTVFTDPVDYPHSVLYTRTEEGYTGDLANYTNAREGASGDETILKSLAATISLSAGDSEIPPNTLPEAYVVTLKDDSDVVQWTGTLVRPYLSYSTDRDDKYLFYDSGTDELTTEVTLGMLIGLSDLPRSHTSRPLSAWILGFSTPIEMPDLASISNFKICPSGSSHEPRNGIVLPVQYQWRVEFSPTTDPRSP